MPGTNICSSQRRHLLQIFSGLAMAGGLGLTACERSSDQRPTLGDTFPAFALPRPDGQVIDSASYAGKPMLVNFWATWCPPCRKEMADLERLHQTLSPKGLVMIAISVDEDINLVREFVLQGRFSFTVLLDAGQHWLRTALRIQGFPTTFLLDARHTIQDVMMGPREWAMEPVQQSITAQLKL